MKVLPEPWAAYARQQQLLSQATSLTDRSWGLEAAQTETIEAIADRQHITPEGTRRRVATGARRERHRKRLVSIYGPSTTAHAPPTSDNADAANKLNILSRRLGKFDMLLLVAVASGVSHETIAERLFMSPAAVRKRVSRARLANNDLSER